MAEDMVRLLDQIQPLQQAAKFVQSWASDIRVLWFGCGDATTGVSVGSNREVVAATGSVRHTKLTPEIVRLWQGTAVPTAGAVNEVRAFLERYIYLEDQRLFALLSVWIAATYMYSVFNHFGYVFLHSDLPRCGKTRVEELTSELAFEATTPLNSPTPPTIREIATLGGTAIFDTLERWRERGRESFAAAMEILDAGFRRGGVVVKMVPIGDGEWRHQSYEVYAPYMFAAIDKDSLTDTARDRSFVIEMRRKRTSLRLPPFDEACRGTAAALRERLYMLALSKAQSVADAYQSPELTRMVDSIGLNDRAADIWKPLFAVTVALKDDNLTEQLRGLAIDMSADPDRLEEIRQLGIVRDLRTIVGEGGAQRGTTQDFVRSLNLVVGRDCADLHALLTRWGFQQRSARLAAYETPRDAWELTDERLAEIEAQLAG
jgi:hypothetical protein